ncbi:general transcription factor II-I repeat domain-containing protein 2-like [Astyanax mexicanus]|uniref:General transcription factor II-I repeat domain-containing protein 2-like n=1 Tax=Astyanax mexicanus TaxID=7994 RepID=A0A8T2L890_ASTMX|nr:general transcription factor II-I repeat domain-containing protein 2-like [Astyanax mexicanus]
MKSFAVKLRLFEKQVRDHNTAHFPALGEIVSHLPSAKIPGKMEKYANVLTSLITEFNQRFQDFAAIEEDIQVFSSPFCVDVEGVQEELELIKLQCDDTLHSHHQMLPLPEFYRSLEKSRFPLMRRHAKRMISLFGSTYICEQTFSLMTLNKNRLRSRITDRHLCNVLRISTTSQVKSSSFIVNAAYVQDIHRIEITLLSFPILQQVQIMDNKEK